MISKHFFLRRLFIPLVLHLFIAFTSTNGNWWLKLAQTQGPMVCAEEYIPSRETYFAKPWTGGKHCGAETIVQFSCCSGYGRVPGEIGCPLVKPLKNIVETLQDHGMNEFLREADEAGLAPLLTNRGPYTVFATRDVAFQRLTLDEYQILNASRQTRSRPSVLLFTVVEGKMFLDELPETMVPLYREDPLIITKFESGLTTVNCIPFVTTDVEASNGIIHITDSLLLPSRSGTIIDVLAGSPSLSTTAAAVVRAQMANELQDMKSITMFAPIDEAWEALSQPFMEALMEDTASLKDLLNYHILNSLWCSSSLGKENEIKSLEGSSLRLWCNESNILVDDARIIQTDIIASNGIVHQIDKILVPEKVFSLAELLRRRELTMFLKLTEVGGLLNVIERRGAYSVFAPINSAFEDLSNDTLSSIFTDSTLARSIASYHITSGRQVTSSFVDGQNLPTLKGRASTLRIKMHRKRTTLETSYLAVANIEARNGILHEMNKVMVPPEYSILQILEDGNYSIFTTLLNQTRPNLLLSLNNVSATYTVFAPDDQAMQNTPPGMAARLLVDEVLLYKMMAVHIVPEYIPLQGLEPGLTYEYQTINDISLTLRREVHDTVTVAQMSTVTVSDSKATNGIVHKVSRFIEL